MVDSTTSGGSSVLSLAINFEHARRINIGYFESVTISDHVIKEKSGAFSTKRVINNSLSPAKDEA